MNHTIHFITYGDAKFARSKTRLLKEAKYFDVFKTIKGYGPEDLSQTFQETYKDILALPRGGGYWIWRPQILMDTIKKMNDGEFLVYLDAGCTINPLGKERFYEYINMLDQSEYGILSFQMSGNKGAGTLQRERWWTIKEIFEYFDVKRDSEIGNNGQYVGGVLVLKKNAHLMNYMKLFMEAVYGDILMCTDHYNRKGQPDDFIDNRHEQSIASILRKKIGSLVIDDDTWIVPFGSGESLKYPFWATRLRC